MLSTSRGLALLLSFGISVIGAVLIALISRLDAREAILSFFVIWVIAGVSIYVVLERLIFRQIAGLQKMLTTLKKGDDPDVPETQTTLAPLRSFRDEISAFAEKNQEEIDRLRKLEAFRREFIANVSHELKTPIFAAQGFLHTLLDGAVNDKTVRMKFLRKAARSLDGLDALVQDLLVLSHIETGQIKMHFELFDLYKLTEEVFEQFEDKVERKNIGLRIEGAQRPVMAYCDPQRINQVLTNLVSNAIRHSFDDGEVLVSFSLSRKSVVVSVADQGEGIAPEHQSRIFERFYRVDKSRTRDQGKGGTGLGLAIVKHILEGHNTRAEVESAPGRGSVFSFKLPRFQPETE